MIERPRILMLAAVVALMASACSSDAAPPAEEAEAPAASAEDQTSSATPVDTASLSADRWVVTATAVGPLRFGMTVEEVRDAAGPVSDSTAIGTGCTLIPIPAAPDSLLFMFEGQELVRVDVLGGETATAEGARVGDPEARIESLYPDLRRLPHKYEPNAFYLIALPEAPADTVHRVVFESNGDVVTRYRAGIYPQVEYVEGCG